MAAVTRFWNGMTSGVTLPIAAQPICVVMCVGVADGIIVVTDIVSPLLLKVTLSLNGALLPVSRAVHDFGAPLTVADRLAVTSKSTWDVKAAPLRAALW